MTPAWTTDIVTPDLRRAVHYTLLWGLEGVALRTVGGPGDRVPFVNEAALRRRLDEAELPVVAVDPGLFEGAASARAAWLNDLDALLDTVRFCERVGCGLVRVGGLGAEGGVDPGAAAEALRRAGDVVARAGLRLGVRNEGGSGVATGAALAALLEAAAHPALGADWRPADALSVGERPGDGLEALTEAGVDVVCVGVRDSAPGEDVERGAVPGEGGVGWPAHLGALHAAGFEGPLILDAMPGPVGTHGLRTATALVRMARAARRGV